MKNFLGLCLVLSLALLSNGLQCPATTDFDATWRATSAGSSLYGTCLTGFVGQPLRACSSDGTWADPTKFCYPSTNTCPANTYANSLWPLTNIGVIANGVCNQGYSGTPTRKCNFDSTWATSVMSSCTVISCAAVNESLASFPKTLAGNLAIGTCVPGYGGRVMRNCSWTGDWQTISGQCLQCVGDHYGEATWPTTAASTYGYGVCDPGWYGTPKRWCQPDGTYQTYIYNNCQVVRCNTTTEGNAVFPAVNNGVYSYGTCQSGYIGSPNRVCYQNGTFGPIIQPCLPDTTVCAGKTYGNQNFPDASPGATVNGVCLAGYHTSNGLPPTLKCLLTGAWSTTIGNGCTRIQCLTETLNGITYPTANSNSTILGPCPVGESGHMYRLCDITGSWQAPFGSCS